MTDETFRSAGITIRNLNAIVKERLHVRADEHGRLMKAEARRIVQTAFSDQANVAASTGPSDQSASAALTAAMQSSNTMR